MKRIATSMATIVFIVAHTSFAAITWGTATNIVGDTDVSTAGTLHASLNVGNSTTETINGVTFNASDANLVINGYANTDYINGPLATDLVPATGSYSNALETGEYNFDTITINGLTIGQEYLVQVWSSDAREATTPGVPGRYITLDDTATVHENQNHDNTASTFGQWITGTFVADQTSQTISVKGFNSDNTEYAGSIAVNMAQVRAVPEAASMTMIILSAGFFLATNRFMRR